MKDEDTIELVLNIGDVGSVSVKFHRDLSPLLVKLALAEVLRGNLTPGRFSAFAFASPDEKPIAADVVSYAQCSTLPHEVDAQRP